METIAVNLIAAHVYPLNKSRSKFAAAGLTHHRNGSWTPEVVLCGQKWLGVRLTPKEWSVLNQNATRFQAHLDGHRCDPEISISPRCTLLMQDLYNNRVVIVRTVDGKFYNCFRNLRSLKKYQENKTIFIYFTDFGKEASVIMQKVTFDGLMRVSDCITEWVAFLEYHGNALEHLWDQVKKLRYNPRSGDTLSTVKEFMTTFTEFMRCDIVYAIVCREMVLYDEDENKKTDVQALYQRQYPY